MTVFPIKGCDYSTSHPKISALAPAGIKFVIRYVSPGANPKNLTLAELTALRAAGIEAGIVFESYAGRILAGHSAGVSDAQTADAEVKALGLTGIPVHFACDTDPNVFTAPQWTQVLAYLDGAASVIGHARTGGYGAFAFIKRAFDAMKITYGWQTYAWSLAATPLPPHAVKVQVPGDSRWFMFDTRAQLRQIHNGVPLGGGTVDMDEAHAADFGQWPRPVTGPFRHVVPAGNTQTWPGLAAVRGTTEAHLDKLRDANIGPEQADIWAKWTALRVALKAAGHPEPVLSAGMAYWTTNP